jgi:hypothetical protein
LVAVARGTFANVATELPPARLAWRQRRVDRDQGGRFSITGDHGESVDITADDLATDDASKATRDRTGQPTYCDALASMQRKMGLS